MASAIGDSVANQPVSVTPRELFRKLFAIAWIKDDPILKVKLREIVIRWFEAKRLLEEPLSANEDLFVNVCRKSSPLPELKRRRAMSEDSIVEVKLLANDESDDAPSGDSTSSTPALEEPKAWECKRCTFVNEDVTVTACIVCGWFKARSVEATGTRVILPEKKEYAVELFIKSRSEEPSCPAEVDLYKSILSRSLAGIREESLTGPQYHLATESRSCTVWVSAYNLLASGQAQEEAAWMDALEKDVFAIHSLDEELIFRKRFLAAVQIASGYGDYEELDDSTLLLKLRSQYASACGSILATSFPNVVFCPPGDNCDSWSEVHTQQYLTRLSKIHHLLVLEAREHYEKIGRKKICLLDAIFLEFSEQEGRSFCEALLLDEPRCDLNVHCLSQVEGDNEMDRFTIPAAKERARLVLNALMAVWEGREESVFVAARPPGHHCPSFEDRFVGLSSSSTNHCRDEGCSLLAKQIHAATGSVPRELGMGFCTLNALAVAVRRFQELAGESFLRANGRSLRIAIVDLDIHAGNGTELVFRNSKSVLHVSFHRYGRIGEDSIMPGTHSYKDVGGVFGKLAGKTPKGLGYSVNITLRKGDGNAEVLSGFEGVALPILQQFAPDIVLLACGFDGLKLSPIFTERWGEESCPGMDAEYTPSLYGYIAARIRTEVQAKIVAATEGGYDPLSVGLGARSLVKGLKGAVPKPPLRTFNSDWLHHLNNIFQLQANYWTALSR